MKANKCKFKQLQQSDFEEFMAIALSEKGEFYRPSVQDFYYDTESGSFVLVQKQKWVGQRDECGNPIPEDISYTFDEWVFSINGIESDYFVGFTDHRQEGWLSTRDIDTIYKMFLVNRGIISSETTYDDVKSMYDKSFA